MSLPLRNPTAGAFVTVAHLGEEKKNLHNPAGQVRKIGEHKAAWLDEQSGLFCIVDRLF